MTRITIFRLIFCFILLKIVSCVFKPCVRREYPNGIVCVCNVSYCDTTDVPNPTKFGEYIIVTSSKSGQRFNASKGFFVPHKAPPKVLHVERSIENDTEWNDDDKSVNSITMTLDREKQFQKIVGFGAAYTGAVTHLFDLMPVSLRHLLYRSYYDKDEGIGYSIMRIPIGGTDFDLKPWAYNEFPENDKQLSNFTELDDRDLHRIDQINDLKKVAGIDEIKFVGTAWSPPKWMKTNNAWSGYGSLKQEYYNTWADYHLKYLHLMAAKNIKYWAITTGNEPLNGVIGWFFIHFMSLGWLPENQGKWIGNNLGPALNNSEFRDIKIFAGDDQRYTYPWWFNKMKNGASNAMDFVSGLAVHWYWDRLVTPQVLDAAHNQYPDKIILNTESSIGDRPGQFHGPVLGSWSRAEVYALGIIQDLQHHVSGWIDWNLVLNEKGGPSYVNNFVDSAVILNSTTNDEFYKQPIFYSLGHFSKFIPPGSVRIAENLSGYKSSTIKTVAFLCPDNTVTVIFYNNSNKDRIIEFTDELRGTYEIKLEARALTTFVFA